MATFHGDRVVLGTTAAATASDPSLDALTPESVLRFRVSERHTLQHLLQFMTWAEFIIYLVFIVLLLVALCLIVVTARECAKKRRDFMATVHYGDR